MEAFVWDQNFITGLEKTWTIQHHALVDLFNELSETFQSTDLDDREDPAERYVCASGRLYRIPLSR
jgi:hypothetical protein